MFVCTVERNSHGNGGRLEDGWIFKYNFVGGKRIVAELAQFCDGSRPNEAVGVTGT